MITNRTRHGIVRTLPQTGRTNVAVDQTIKAMKPGKRISATGNVYWETRKNRSDVNPSKRL